MLSKCANPLCSAPFRYLHEGRIFNIEVGTPFQDPPTLRIEHFWLCGRCARTLKVALDHGVVTLRPLRLELPEGTPEDKRETEPILDVKFQAHVVLGRTKSA